MLKKHRLMMESLPHDVEARILERVPVKTLLRLKAVSKQWKSTIESPFFQERQLKQRQQSGDPDLLMVSSRGGDDPPDIESLRTLVLGSSFDSYSSVKIPTPWEKENTHYLVSYHSCDGLVYLYHPFISGFVVNPATRWYRPIPLCQLQQLMIRLGKTYLRIGHGNGLLKVGFGKDIISKSYKLVWLYNNSCEEIGLGTTRCEVFDFSTNAWRYVSPAAPYRIVEYASPVFVDGSLHWFTDCKETKVVSFDLHTEAFHVISKAPFSKATFVNEVDNPFDIVLCNLDNCLCVSHKTLSNQVIWSFNSSNKTWDKIFSINLEMTFFLYDSPTHSAFYPLALVDGKSKNKKKKKNLLYYDIVASWYLLRHDPEVGFDYLAFTGKCFAYPVCYFQSLISI